MGRLWSARKFYCLYKHSEQIILNLRILIVEMDLFIKCVN